MVRSRCSAAASPSPRLTPVATRVRFVLLSYVILSLDPALSVLSTARYHVPDGCSNSRCGPHFADATDGQVRQLPG